MNLYVFRLDDRSGAFAGVVLIAMSDPPAVWRKCGADQAPEHIPHMVASREKAELETEVRAPRVREAGIPLRLRRFELENVIRRAMVGIMPTRHGELAQHRPEELVLRVKHAVLTEEKGLEKLRREVEAFENFERIRATPREPIPEHIRMFVWQRDRGRCVKCGCQERLEFDHVIPLASGGSNTERNIQMLCESCNREKGTTV